MFSFISRRGWFDGDEAQLYYTKSYFCAEPLLSGAPTGREIGAASEVAPIIDGSRIGGLASGPALSHSHILESRAGGWFHTVHIRVFTASAWTEIATARNLATVRKLHGGNPKVGVPGVISADTPTNIYFFIAGWR